MARQSPNLYGFPTPINTVFPAPIIAQRAPTTSDIEYPPGQVWVDQAGNEVFFLVEVVAGSARWDLAAGTGAYPITPYVVGPVGQAGYQTVQAAITAASAAGGGTVYIQRGTYTENLTLADNVTLIGEGYLEVTIVGVHTPPATGDILLQDLTLNSATHIFSSAAAGTTTISLLTCVINVTNGFIFNLTNWTGALTIDDCGSGGTSNGIMTNTGGSALRITDATVGAGTGQTMVARGAVTIVGSVVQCPSDFQTGASLTATHTDFTGAITFSNDSTATISTSRISTGAAAAVTMSSTGAVGIFDTVVTSSNNPAIAGTGAGTLTLGKITFTSNTALASTLTIGSGDLVAASSFRTNVLATGSTLSSSTWQATGSDTNISLTLTPKGSGSVVHSRGLVGGDVTIEATNTDNTNGASRAGFESAVGGTSSGDPYFQSLISGGQVYSWGIDNSTANDNWVLSKSSTLGTSNVLSFDGSTNDATFSGAISSSTTDITFAQSPLLQSNANTGAAPSGATGDVNLMSLQTGEIMEEFILGAGQTIIAPRMTTTGLLTSLDLTATEGAEYNWGQRANALHTFTIGTSAAFFMELEVNAADVGGLDPLLVGFRKVQANDATLANYTDFAGIGANATTAADVAIIQTQLNSGGVVITNTTDAWTDGQTKTFRINVSAAGVVTYLINGVAPTVTAAFTFDSTDVVAPFIRHLFGATNPGAINWVSMRVGPQ